jgi:hypothetical protein
VNAKRLEDGRVTFESGPRHFVLDPKSPTWRIACELFQARINELQQMLERDQTEVATASLRGRIRELRELLALEGAAVTKGDGDETPRHRSHYHVTN